MGKIAAITTTKAREMSAETLLAAGLGICGCLDDGQFRVTWHTESGDSSLVGGPESLFTLWFSLLIA